MNKNTVLITGASRGIGRETAILFAKNGYNVAINYLNNEVKANKLKDELESLGARSICVKADVSDINQVQKMVELINKELGFINVLVNNAGIAQQKLFSDISLDDWDKMFNVNVKGMFNCCKCVLPEMIKNHEGKIINVSSIWGLVGASCEVHYSASKAAVIGFTKALAKEVGPSNIMVNCVAPGVINTDMNSSLDNDTIESLKEETPLEKIGEPIDVANTILFLATSKSNFITGQVISVNGGFVI